ncbi:MAG TPA: hypothetical protein VGE25_06825 [Sediminibacterium sp.]
MQITTQKLQSHSARLVNPDLSLDRIAVICCALLFFVMGRFQLTDMLGLKRIFEGLLFIPISVYAIFRIRDLSFKKHVNGLLIVVLITLVTKAIYGEYLKVFDNFFALTALYAILSAPKHHVIAGIKSIIILDTFFSLIALLQLIILILFPDLTINTQLALLDSGIWTTISETQGAVVVSSFHPIAFLGLMTSDQLNVFGIQVARMRSFVSEPSLLVIFFMLPAVMGFFLKMKFWTNCSLIILLFCLLSISGSVQVCIIFAGLFFLLSSFFPTRFLFIWTPLAGMAVMLFIMITLGLDLFTNFDMNLSQSENTNFLAKGNSLVTRGNGLIFGANEALRSPFGSQFGHELPLSVFLSVILNAGWIGAILLLIFFSKLITRISLMRKIDHSLVSKIGISILFGIICTIFLFNDYAVLNYTGLVLFTFLYRQLEIEK